MNELEHAKTLLLLAEKDFKALQGMQDSDIFAEEIFGFRA